MNSHKSLLGEVIRYGLVGVVASIVHVLIALGLYKLVAVSPFWSNACGVFGGMITAYLGHFHYSFNNKGRHKNLFPKFVLTSLIGLGLHQAGVLLLVNQLQLDYSTLTLPILMVSVPMVTFLLSKFWVFR